MTTAHFDTSGMHCSKCPERIEAELRPLEGVQRVLARRDLSLTSVTFDEARIGVPLLRRRLSEAGFPSELVRLSDPN